jgi:hypothetical protein
LGEKRPMFRNSWHCAAVTDTEWLNLKRTGTASYEPA